MAVRTARLAAGITGPANVSVVGYTCPSGKTAIVKTIQLSAPAGALGYSLVWSRSGPQEVVVSREPLAANLGRRVETWHVLEPGDELLFGCDVAAGLRWWVSGTELDGVAP